MGADCRALYERGGRYRKMPKVDERDERNCLTHVAQASRLCRCIAVLQHRRDAYATWVKHSVRQSGERAISHARQSLAAKNLPILN